jgi:hypothetical protein
MREGGGSRHGPATMVGRRTGMAKCTPVDASLRALATGGGALIERSTHSNSAFTFSGGRPITARPSRTTIGRCINTGWAAIASYN